MSDWPKLKVGVRLVGVGPARVRKVGVVLGLVGKIGVVWPNVRMLHWSTIRLAQVGRSCRTGWCQISPRGEWGGVRLGGVGVGSWAGLDCQKVLSDCSVGLGSGAVSDWAVSDWAMSDGRTRGTQRCGRSSTQIDYAFFSRGVSTQVSMATRRLLLRTPQHSRNALVSSREYRRTHGPQVRHKDPSIYRYTGESSSSETCTLRPDPTAAAKRGFPIGNAVIF